MREFMVCTKAANVQMDNAVVEEFTDPTAVGCVRLQLMMRVTIMQRVTLIDDTVIELDVTKQSAAQVSLFIRNARQVGSCAFGCVGRIGIG